MILAWKLLRKIKRNLVKLKKSKSETRTCFLKASCTTLNSQSSPSRSTLRIALTKSAPTLRLCSTVIFSKPKKKLKKSIHAKKKLKRKRKSKKKTRKKRRKRMKTTKNKINARKRKSQRNPINSQKLKSISKDSRCSPWTPSDFLSLKASNKQSIYLENPRRTYSNNSKWSCESWEQTLKPVSSSLLLLLTHLSAEPSALACAILWTKLVCWIRRFQIPSMQSSARKVINCWWLFSSKSTINCLICQWTVSSSWLNS